MKVSLGLIVSYKPTERECLRMSEHRSVCNVQPELPAVIVAFGPPDTVNLKVLLDGQGDIWATSVLQGDEEGEWNFYPNEENEFMDEIKLLILKIVDQKKELEDTIENFNVGKEELLADLKKLITDNLPSELITKLVSEPAIIEETPTIVAEPKKDIKAEVESKATKKGK